MGLFDFVKKAAEDAFASRLAQGNVTPGAPAAPASEPLRGSFNPGSAAIEISYVNFRGQPATFTGDHRTAYTPGQYLVIRAVPTGKRVALKLSKIQNCSEIDAQIAGSPRPSPDERRILHYHLRRGTTSALFEKIRKEYPDYTE